MLERSRHPIRLNMTTFEVRDPERNVKRTINCDEGIAPLIKALWVAGFKTKSSCSGLKIDHDHYNDLVHGYPIIIIDAPRDDKKINALKSVLDDLNVIHVERKIIRGYKKYAGRNAPIPATAYRTELWLQFVGDNGGRVVEWCLFLPRIVYPDDEYIDKFNQLIEKLKLFE